MAAANRVLTLVAPPSPQPQDAPGSESRASFAREVLQVMEEHRDIAAEATWQALALVVMRYWERLSSDQSPEHTWGMVSKAAETVLKIRRTTRSRQGQDAEEELAAFRRLMHHVIGAGDDNRVR